MSAVVRPDWWCYPLQCPSGHPWAPGRVTVGWMPCDCARALSSGLLGHLWVRCRAHGCPSIWYRPQHDKVKPSLSLGPCSRRSPGAWRGQVSIAADFDELPEEIDAAFRGDAT
jgi:hypothetical protein